LTDLPPTASGLLGLRVVVLTEQGEGQIGPGRREVVPYLVVGGIIARQGLEQCLGPAVARARLLESAHMLV